MTKQEYYVYPTFLELFFCHRSFSPQQTLSHILVFVDFFFFKVTSTIHLFFSQSNICQFRNGAMAELGSYFNKQANLLTKQGTEMATEIFMEVPKDFRSAFSPERISGGRSSFHLNHLKLLTSK